MRVVSSEVRLRASHVSEVHSETTGSLRAWVGERPRADDPSARVQVSAEALGAMGAGAALIGAARSGPLAYLTEDGRAGFMQQLDLVV